MAFAASNGIRLVVFDMKGTKKEAIPVLTMTSIIEVVLDQQNHPLLIHCNHGKHRTGCVVATVRLLSGWTPASAIDEYKAYAEPKVRQCDIDYIGAFDRSAIRLPSALPRGGPVRTRSFVRSLILSTLVVMVWFGYVRDRI